ncbi:MAG: integron integrase [Candidatus Riflebacteria bacterium]|nr:integron integrase [Candidatus Riflebacteria bacterium]
MQKLTEKGQPVEKQKQAFQSVKVYLDIVANELKQEEKQNVRDVIDLTTTDAGKEAAGWSTVFSSLKDAIRLRNYSKKTFKTYASWINRFAWFVKSKNPEEVVIDDVKQFLTDLAVNRNVAATTQNQAFNALLFLFRHIFGRPDDFDVKSGVVRAKSKKYIPVVLSREEVDQIISKMRQPYSLVVKLLYGCGLRLFEALNLRVQCLDFSENIVTVHDGKGLKDRTLPLPMTVLTELHAHIEQLRVLHNADLDQNFLGVFMPNSADRKFRNQARDFSWQWLFPAKALTLVPEEGGYRRYHLHETHVQKAIRSAVLRCQLTKRATAHTFRHSFASHLLQANYDIRTIQKMLGHTDVRTTMIYTNTVRSRTLKEQKSPLDF